MSILFGHPTGNPNSHHAALAHFESGRLEAFCVPWMPTSTELRLIEYAPGLKKWSTRLERRSFPPLIEAPRIEGRLGEWKRMAKRFILDGAVSSEALSYDANDWLMKTMARECARPAVAAVHSYEDCSLLQFEQAKKLGKACIYDMPIGYYPAWEDTQNRLAAEFSDWLPNGELPSEKYVRPAQKKSEMELADLVIAPSTFVAQTIQQFVDKVFAIAPYGVDSEFWHPSSEKDQNRPLRFIYAGQSSVRKGIPFLLKVWERAALRNAQLFLVGSWQLAETKLRKLPAGVSIRPPCSTAELRSYYQSADVFLFPSYFEGFGLVLLEAMACGLPAIASERTAAPDLLNEKAGRIVPAGNLDAWIAALQSISQNRDKLPEMKSAAREIAMKQSWKRYRDEVSKAVSEFV